MPTFAFICSANMCRSPMAEAIFRHRAAERGMEATVFSAGTLGFTGYAPVDEAQEACRRRGVPLRASAVSTSVHTVAAELAACERIFVMEDAHRRYLIEHNLAPPDRIEMLGRFRKGASPHEEIPDPIGQDSAAFDRCFELLNECIEGYLASAH